MLSRALCEQLIPLLVSLPIGKLWARYLPNVTLFGLELNPGPFTIKEHVITTIMASVGSSPAYAVSATQLCHIAAGITTISHATSRPK